MLRLVVAMKKPVGVFVCERIEEKNIVIEIRTHSFFCLFEIRV